MRLAFTFLLVAHGVIHALGCAKAFRPASLPQLAPIGTGAGWFWLVAGLLMALSAVAIFTIPRWWWLIAALAVVGSQTVILMSWRDARFGTIANVIVAIGAIFGFLWSGPSSLRAAYDEDVRRGLSRPAGSAVLTESDLASLPPVVRRYVAASGAIGRPRVRGFRAAMHGRIRSSATAGWMPFTAEQYDFFDETSRFFSMTASMLAVPVQGYHRYVGPFATMRVKAAGLVPVANAAGPEMDQAETVTFFNDMCLFAPASLIDPRIRWEPTGPQTVRAAFTNAGHTVRADLTFNDAGDLIDFVSDDRYMTMPDGRMALVRWSTPLADYKTFDPYRLGATGEARWHPESGSFAYIQLTLDAIDLLP